MTKAIFNADMEFTPAVGNLAVGDFVIDDINKAWCISRHEGGFTHLANLFNPDVRVVIPSSTNVRVCPKKED